MYNQHRMNITYHCPNKICRASRASWNVAHLVRGKKKMKMDWIIQHNAGEVHPKNGRKLELRQKGGDEQKRCGGYLCSMKQMLSGGVGIRL